jgi:hypothetical protein
MASKPDNPKKPRGGARENAGRPQHAPTDQQRQQVEALSGYGIHMAEIASMIGIDEKTIRVHYAEEMARGRARANSAVAKTLFERATKKDDTTAMIWWTKARMGWSEKQQHEHSGPGGGAIQSEATVVLDPSEAYKRLIGGKA